MSKTADLGVVLLPASTGQCFVGRVVPGSPAALSRNVWVGDVVESINDRVLSLSTGQVVLPPPSSHMLPTPSHPTCSPPPHTPRTHHLTPEGARA